MRAYMIVTASLKDRDAFINGYGAAAGKLVAQFGGKYVLRGPGAELLEGNFGAIDFGGASMVISEWPDKAAGLLPVADLVIEIEPLDGDRRAVDLAAHTALGRGLL